MATRSPERDIDLFLCHTGVDKDWVEHLAARLEAERIGKRTLRIFLDKWDIELGENVLTKIEEGLRRARLVGVVLSPALTHADWPKLEWQTQVYADPAGRLARLVPILRHRADPTTGEVLEVPLPLQLLKYADFSDDRRFEAAFSELVRKIRGEPPARGRSTGAAASEAFLEPGGEVWRANPDEHPETLLSNLFPVVRQPQRVWSDVTTAGEKRDVWAAYRGNRVLPFALNGGRLYAFLHLDAPKNQFRPFLTGASPLVENPQTWLSHPDRSRIYVGLLNAGLKEHCYGRKIHVARKEAPPRFFCPIFGKTRTFRWGTNQRARTLAIMKSRPSGEPFGVHHAARMRFIVLGERLFLLIEPTYLFTSNGVTPLTGRQVTRLASAWGGRERNRAVLRNTIMWARLLSGGNPNIQIAIGAESVEISAVPARADLMVGLSGDTMDLVRLAHGEGGGEDGMDDAEMERLAVLEMAGALVDDDVPSGADEQGNSVLEPLE